MALDASCQATSGQAAINWLAFLAFFWSGPVHLMLVLFLSRPVNVGVLLRTDLGEVLTSKRLAFPGVVDGEFRRLDLP